MEPTIRRGEAADAMALSVLAARTFYETFAADNNPDDLAQYMQLAYGVEQQRGELLDPRIETLVVETGNDLVAYAMVRESETPDCVTGPAPIELWRFYVRREWHGRGVAQELMTAVEASARARGAGTLWLGVWERNLRAQAFYRKRGFVDVGSHIFVVGTDPQTDRIFARGTR